MKLILDVISGQFQGNQIILDSLNSHIVRPMLTETDPIKITLELDSPVTSATILIEDARIKLSPENDGGKRFSAMPSHYAGSNHTALFHNYFGIALLYVETTTNTEGTDSNIELVGEVDILARKLTSDQAQGMLKYILDSGNVDLLRSQGATRRGISSSDDESKPAKKIIEQLEETVKLFENALPKLVRSPLSTLKSNLEIVSVTRDLEIQDDGVAWLCENAGVLKPADEEDNYLTIYKGQKFSADEIQTSVTREHTDIYENRVIHGFIDGILVYTHQLISDFNISQPIQNLNSLDGYDSFFSVMGEWVSTESNSNIRKIEDLQARVKRIQAALTKHVPVSMVMSEQPKFTPKVRSSLLYSSLYRAMLRWHSQSSIDLTVEKMLMAINSVPKLFELYTILLVADWLKQKDSVVIENGSYLLSANINGTKLKLSYEPTFWMTKHVNADESGIVRTQMGRVSESYQNQTRPGRTRHSNYLKRQPDIVLELFKTYTETEIRIGIVVLDAKYTSRKLAFESKLPDCTMKYVHGLGCRDLSSPVKAMIILYPDSDGPWLDFHASDYGIHGSNPQLPVLGVQGLSITSDNHPSELSSNLDQIITLLCSENEVTGHD